MASGSLRPGSPIGSVRSSAPSLAENFAGSGRSTPVVSARPISKISASSMASPRLPLKVSGSLSTVSPTAVGLPWRFSIWAPPDGDGRRAQ